MEFFRDCSLQRQLFSPLNIYAVVPPNANPTVSCLCAEGIAVVAVSWICSVVIHMDDTEIVAHAIILSSCMKWRKLHRVDEMCYARSSADHL